MRTGYGIETSVPPAPYVRPPAVAGRFYPGEAGRLRSEVERAIGDAAGARPAVGAVAPHAGYVYSGGVAGRTFADLAVPRRVVILAPNHTGRGAPIAVVASGSFRVPGADVPIDEELARAALAEIPGAREDARAHEHEHAIEVELPFLLARRPDVRIVPIVLGGIGEAEALAVGQALARAASAAAPGEEMLVLASSDMSHYLPDADTRVKDRLAIDRLLALDAPGLYRTVRDHDISMCGYLPATAMLAYAHARGAREAELCGYATSGDASGDRDRVVGYAGVTIR